MGPGARHALGRAGLGRDVTSALVTHKTLRVSPAAPTTSHHSPCGTRTRSPRPSCCAPSAYPSRVGSVPGSPATSCGTSSVRRPASSPRSTHPWRGAPRRDPPTVPARSPRRRNTIARRPSGARSKCSTAAAGARPVASEDRVEQGRGRRLGWWAPPRVARREPQAWACPRRERRVWMPASRPLAATRSCVGARCARARAGAAAARATARERLVASPAASSRSSWSESPFGACLGSSCPCHGAGCPPPIRAGCPKVLSRTRLRVVHASLYAR